MKKDLIKNIFFIIRWVMVLLILSVMSIKLINLYEKVNNIEIQYQELIGGKDEN